VREVRHAALLVLVPALVPTPIGVGPRYQPPAGVHGACAPGALGGAPRVHLELFANKRVVIVPTAIGLRGARFSLGRVTGARCRARVWTTEPTGVVSFSGGATLADVFAVWGEPFGPARLASFRGAVSLFRNGVRVPGAPGRFALRNGDELVLEVGGFVPPHRSYRFPA
jgi:hypothetical protein